MFQGSLVALVTPMTEAGAVDDAALANLVEFHIEQGTQGIIVMGTTGESATFAPVEHIHVVRRVVELVADRLPVIAGTGSNSTREAIDLTRAAKEAGVAGCLLVVPYYNKPSQEGLFLHYQAIAAEVAIPQILYNVPGRTACDLLPATVARLARIPNIVAIKEANSDPTRVPALCEACEDRLVVLSGEDPSACQAMLDGARGVISVTANIVPAAMRKLVEAATQPDRAAAEALDAGLAELHRAMFLEANPIPVKWALHEMGMIPPGIRLPLTPLAEPHWPALRAALQAAGVSRVGGQ